MGGAMRWIRYWPDLAVLAALVLVPLATGSIFPNQKLADKSLLLFGFPLLLGLLFATRPAKQVLTSLWALILLGMGLYWLAMTLTTLRPSEVDVAGMLILGCLGFAIGWIYGRRGRMGNPTA